jgi:hypothetical protein
MSAEACTPRWVSSRDDRDLQRKRDWEKDSASATHDRVREFPKTFVTGVSVELSEVGVTRGDPEAVGSSRPRRVRLSPSNPAGDTVRRIEKGSVGIAVSSSYRYCERSDVYRP